MFSRISEKRYLMSRKIRNKFRNGKSDKMERKSEILITASVVDGCDKTNGYVKKRI